MQLATDLIGAEDFAHAADAPLTRRRFWGPGVGVRLVELLLQVVFVFGDAPGAQLLSRGDRRVRALAFAPAITDTQTEPVGVMSVPRWHFVEGGIVGVAAPAHALGLDVPNRGALPVRLRLSQLQGRAEGGAVLCARGGLSWVTCADREHGNTETNGMARPIDFEVAG